MKIALDPYMQRHVPLLEQPRLVAELGYEYIELSPRASTSTGKRDARPRRGGPARPQSSRNALLNWSDIGFIR